MENCKGKSIGQPIVGCDCEYCYPRLRQWYKEKRDKEAPHKANRFKFVKAVIESGTPIDDNNCEMTRKWNQIIGDESSLMTTNNIMKVPALLSRLKLYIPFDGRNLHQRTKDRVREIWNMQNEK